MANQLDDENVKVPIEDLLADDEPVEDEEVIGDMEDEKTPKKEKKEDKEDDEDEDEDKEELKIEGEEDEEEEEPAEEELELVIPIRAKEILAKYPKVFDEFPYLKAAFYRDKQFTEIVPTVQDARAAVEKAQTLDKFSNELTEGNPKNLLKAVHEADGEGFAKLVDNYLPALAEVDQNAYFHIVTNMHKATVANMVAEAQRTNNEGLMAAATILYQWVTGNTNYQPPSTYSKQPIQQEDKALNAERAKFAQEKLQHAYNSVSTRVVNALKSTVDQNIDPKGLMTSYIKEKAIKDVLEMVDNSLSSNDSFRKMYDTLWRRAAENNFDQNSMNKIRAAYLSWAKPSLKRAIAVVQRNAIKGIAKRSNNDDDEETPKSKKPIAPGKAATSSNRSQKSSLIGKDGKKMSTLDFLMQED